MVFTVELGLFLLTLPDELRHHRWKRLGVSFLLVGAGAMLGPLVSLVAIALMAFLWTDVLSHYGAAGLVSFFQRDVSSETGIKPDFHYARNHRRDGETAKAVAAIEHELKKSPESYEGLMLLAEIYQDRNQPGEALKRLQIIVDSASATDDQKDYARWEQEKCRQLQRHLGEQALFNRRSSR